MVPEDLWMTQFKEEAGGVWMRLPSKRFGRLGLRNPNQDAD